MESQEKDEIEKPETDKMDTLIAMLTENADVLISLTDMLSKLKNAGIIKLLNEITDAYLPTDVEFFGQMLSSKEFSTGIMKLLNVLVGVVYAFSDERTSDMMKALLFNLPEISKVLVDNVSSGKKVTPIGLYSAIKKDGDLSLGLNALLKTLSAVTHSLKTLDYSDPLPKMKMEP